MKPLLSTNHILSARADLTRETSVLFVTKSNIGIFYMFFLLLQEHANERRGFAYARAKAEPFLHLKTKEFSA